MRCSQHYYAGELISLFAVQVLPATGIDADQVLGYFDATSQLAVTFDLSDNLRNSFVRTRAKLTTLLLDTHKHRNPG